jgi:hypothetical protein
VNVTEATLQEIALHPPDTIVTWAPSTFGASGTFSDGTVQDLTRWVTWAPQDPSLLRIRGTGPDRGIARGVDAGTVQVSRPSAGRRGAQRLGDGDRRAALLPRAGASRRGGRGGDAAPGPGNRPGAGRDERGRDRAGGVEQLGPGARPVSSVVAPGSVRALRTGTPTLTARFAGLTTGAPLQITAGTLTRLSVTAPGP